MNKMQINIDKLSQVKFKYISIICSNIAIMNFNEYSSIQIQAQWIKCKHSHYKIKFQWINGKHWHKYNANSIINYCKC